METSTVKPPAWFWAIGVLALLWNLMGVGAYLAQAFMSADDLAALGDAERALVEQQPAWVTAAFAIAVWGGFLASILLLARKKWAIAVFVISFLGAVGQQIYTFFLSNAMEVQGPEAYILPIAVLLIAVALIFFSRKAAAKQWIG
jgi:hypothetical protein